MKGAIIINLLITFLCIHLINCSLFTPHHCAKVPQTKNLDIKRVTGDWYVLVTSMAGIKEGDRCHRVTFSLVNDGILQIKTNWIEANGKQVSTAINDTINQNNPAEVHAEIEVTVKGLTKSYNKTITISGSLVDTDYTNYQVIYSCFQLDHFWVSEKVDTFLILTKSRNFDSIKKLIPIFNKLSELKVDANTIGFIDNGLDCPN